MEAKALSTEPRSERGKNASRQLRARHMIPAVFYTRGVAPVALSVSPKELTAALSTEFRRNQLIKLQIDGQDWHALVQELQVDPVSRVPLHVDFYGLEPEAVIERMVPLRATGRAAGVIAGGDLRVLYRQLAVRGPAMSIPADILVDVTPMQLGDVVRVKDLAVPQGVTVCLSPDRNVITVAAGRRRAAPGADNDADQQPPPGKK